MLQVFNMLGHSGFIVLNLIKLINEIYIAIDYLILLVLLLIIWSSLLLLLYFYT